MATEITAGVHRLGSELINWYIVDDGGRLTVVDTAVPGYWPQFDEALRTIGRSRGDVEAVLLTHGDLDHVGVAERLRTELGVPVYLHPVDRPLAHEHKRKKTEGSTLSMFRHRMGRRFVREFMRTGLLKTPKLRESQPLADGQTVDVPGRPRVIHTPGHTKGQVAFHFESHGTVVAGDTICSLDPIYGDTGPRLMPRALNVSSDEALRSLGRIEQLEAQTVLFGHGEPWTGGTLEAVERARAAGAR